MSKKLSPPLNKDYQEPQETSTLYWLDRYFIKFAQTNEWAFSV